MMNLKNLTKICQNITKKKINISSKSRTSIYDIPYYVSNNSKVQKTYKWNPKNTIIDIVRDTHLWLDKNKKELKKYL